MSARKARRRTERRDNGLPEPEGVKLPPPEEGQIVVTPAALIEPERIEWAWEPYLPLRSVSLLAGGQGLGKSTLFCELAARLSRGDLEGSLEGEPASVVIASSEDSAKATLVPRLMAADADLYRVGFVRLHSTQGDSLAVPGDLHKLAPVIHSRAARVLMLDPLLSFVELDSHKDQEVRRALAPLAEMADRLDLAVVGLMHLNKREGHDALARVMGSVGFTALARSVLLLGSDREHEDRLHLVHAKSNLAPRGASQACHVEGAVVRHKQTALETSRLVFDGHSDVRAEEVLGSASSPDELSERGEAIRWLQAALTDGPVPSSQLLKRCEKEVPCSTKTLRRAQKTLGVVAHQTASGWVWSLPGEEVD